MPKLNPKTQAIREAKFIQALAEHGTAKMAYKAIAPHVKDNSAKAMGSQALAKIDHEDINALYERIGCTKENVLTELYQRMKKTRKDEVFVKGTSLMAKIGGWEGNRSALADLMSKDLDLVEVIKIRLRKSNNKKDLGTIIDAQYTPSNDLDRAKE